MFWPGLATLVAVLVWFGWTEYRRARRFTAQVAAARRHATEIERFRAITHTLLAGRQARDTLQAIATAAAELVGADSGYIALTTPGGGIAVAAATGSTLEYVGRELPRDGSVAGWVAAHGASALINDLTKDPRAFHAANARLGVVREVVVPLLSRGAAIGAIGANRGPEGPPFDANDVTLLERLGEQAVLAVEYGQALEQARRASATLAVKNAELEQAVRAKSEFLRNMSHELRTPLNSIIGFSELLSSGAGGALTSDAREYLTTVIRNSRHLLQLINDLLDLAKVDAGRMDLHLAPVNILSLIDGVLEDTRGLLAGRQLAVKQDFMQGPMLAVCDEVRIRQVLFNFLSNAVKFTPDGGEIAIRAVRTAAPLPVPAQRAGDTARLRTRPAVWIAVSDTGQGISGEDMARLFKEFEQVDSSTSRKSGGTGLGLVLSRRFIELHGGTIGAESLPGRGSTFWILLPEDGPVRVGSAIAAGAGAGADA